MKLKHILSRSVSEDDLHERRRTPWIASPLDTRAREALSEHEQGNEEELKLKSEGRVLEFREAHRHRRVSELPISKAHHESSTVELFYDLFFVANLTTFTANHEIRNTDSELLKVFSYHEDPKRHRS